ncbi:hypothetical protein NDU88_002538 [Pleurodeles waltl]|uniref:Uncharacterized protein n=1 Tax=Pleurodeles waltl TaxID=8319 RepID=A0AAV7RFV6_PLEWA|nr:hypothetical protein NDU88_002538 [Pleurodeles waltl]
MTQRDVWKIQWRTGSWCARAHALGAVWETHLPQSDSLRFKSGAVRTHPPQGDSSLFKLEADRLTEQVPKAAQTLPQSATPYKIKLSQNFQEAQLCC